MHNWEFYPSGLEVEYRQSVDEGLDIEAYKPVFDAVSKLPKNEIKNDFGNVISKIVLNANIRKDYKYIEPSELDEIRALSEECVIDNKIDTDNFEEIILCGLSYIPHTSRLYEDVNKILQCKSYFCNAYHSWEKGMVENINGLIRRFFPKGTNFDNVSDIEIQYVEDWINNRSMKILNWNSPNDVYDNMVKSVAV